MAATPSRSFRSLLSRLVLCDRNDSELRDGVGATKFDSLTSICTACAGEDLVFSSDGMPIRAFLSRFSA